MTFKATNTKYNEMKLLRSAVIVNLFPLAIMYRNIRYEMNWSARAHYFICSQQAPMKHSIKTTDTQLQLNRSIRKLIKRKLLLDHIFSFLLSFNYCALGYTLKKLFYCYHMSYDICFQLYHLRSSRSPWRMNSAEKRSQQTAIWLDINERYHNQSSGCK